MIREKNMKFPFRIIESTISTRSEFDVTEGYQPTYALFFIKKGSFRIEHDGITEDIVPGDCIILPDYLYFRRNVIEPIEFIYVKFAVNLNCPYSFTIPYGKLIFPDKKRFISNISAIEKLLMNDDLFSVNYREHLLTDILFMIHFEQIEKNTHPQEQTVKDFLVEAAVTYILEHLQHKILIQDICYNVGTNMSTLNFRFRRTFNMSVGQYIVNEKMKKARHLLIGTTYSITEIADRCGFENVYYFSNVFKKVNGISPSKYKNNYK
jgi:AraC-like DNA-binding protein